MKSAITTIFFLFLIGPCTFGQRTEETKGDQSVVIKDLPQELFDRSYNDFEIKNSAFIGKDSFVLTHSLNGVLLAKEHLAIDRVGIVSRIRVGEYIGYYENGNIKELGAFEIGRYTDCCAGGLCSQFYNYKFGEWVYYYENGNMRGEVYYDIMDFHITTSCEGGDSIKYGKVNLSKSVFWDIDGKVIKPSRDLIKVLETVTSGRDKYDTHSLMLDGNIIKRSY